MSFGDHLEELRSCLIRALIGVGLATGVCLVYGKTILLVLYKPLLVVQFANGLPPAVQVLSPGGAFSAYMRLSFLAGVTVSAPWVLYQLWRFVLTGLYVQERRFVRYLAPSSLVLFGAGVVFLYYLVLPIILNFFVSFNRGFDLPDLAPGAVQSLLVPQPPAPTAVPTGNPLLRVPILDEDPSDPQPGDLWVSGRSRRLSVETAEGRWSVSLDATQTTSAIQSGIALDAYVTFVLELALAFGLAFETPLVVFFLVWSGLVTHLALSRGRKYILLGTIVAAAVFTPPDLFSQLLLALPMYLLFELGLYVARFADRQVPDDAPSTPVV